MSLELTSVTGLLFGGRRTQDPSPLKAVRRMCAETVPARAAPAMRKEVSCIFDTVRRWPMEEMRCLADERRE